jgi:hypothetical protein
MDTFFLYKNPTDEKPLNISQADYDEANIGDRLEFSINLENVGNSYSRDPYTNSSSIISALKNKIKRTIAHVPDLSFGTIASSGIVISIRGYAIDNGIQPGSVVLQKDSNYCSDRYLDGILYGDETTIVGIVLYKEGIVILYSGVWTSFDPSADANKLNFARKSDVNTYMTLVYAEKEELSHSNNPTSIHYTEPTLSGKAFKESDRLVLTNTVKPITNSTDGEFQKQSFITKIGLYNKNKELVAIASLASPLRKTSNREFVFKLKLDI